MGGGHDDTGKKVRTKKEITGEDGKIRQGCTALINGYISEPEQHLKVFDKNSVYLPTKKIGKNNPKMLIREQDMPPNLKQELTDTIGVFKGKERKALAEKTQQTEEEISEKLDKLPDIPKEDSYPDIQAFMATYREMEGVVERYDVRYGNTI